MYENVEEMAEKEYWVNSSLKPVTMKLILNIQSYIAYCYDVGTQGKS
jgi:hypothetical protein